MIGCQSENLGAGDCACIRQVRVCAENSLPVLCCVRSVGLLLSSKQYPHAKLDWERIVTTRCPRAATVLLFRS